MKRMLLILFCLFLPVLAAAEHSGIPLPVQEALSSESTLEEGSSGKAVQLLKEQLQKLGYYKPSSSLDDRFTADTAKRISSFQRGNALAVTGTAGWDTVEVLFSENARAGEWYEAPLVPPDSTSFSIGEYAEWGNGKKNTLRFRLRVHNASSAAAAGYEIVLYGQDLWGEPVGERVCLSAVRRVAPGKSEDSDFAVLAGADQLFRVYAAVSRVRYDNDVIVTIPEEELEWWHWDIE